MSHTVGAGLLRAGLVLVAFLTACAPAGPRFPSNVMATFRRDEMRHLKTDNVELYYPAQQKDSALRMLNRLDYCVEKLRKYPVHPRQRPPVLTYLTSANFNNAYAYYSIAGSPRQLLLPTHLSLELFEWFNLGLAEVGDVSCHEALHYVHMEQVEGGWAAVNWLLGDVFSPNAVIEPWFTEGLATYYEAKMDRAAGRPHSPIWRGVLESGLASQGGFRAGDLNSSARHMLPWGAHYLAGSWFVEWLADKYGEEKIWELIHVQANSIFSPLWVSLRFKQVYGTTLDGLITEANADLQAKLGGRERPAAQKVRIEDLGYFARITEMEGGAVAALTTKLDEPPRLSVFEADGSVRFSVPVTPLIPGRPFFSASPVVTTGLSYSRVLPNGADSPSLYVVIDDVDVEGNNDSKLVRFDARTGEYRQHWQGFVGVGGDIRSDGRVYAMVEIVNGVSNLVAFDLLTGKREPLTHYVAGESIAAPHWSPDGKRLVFVRWGGGSFDLTLLGADGKEKALTHDSAFDYFPSWVDDHRIAFSRTEAGRAQIHTVNADTGRIDRITEAPFLAAEPVSTGAGKLAFLNRDGWGWTLDEVALSAEPPAAEEPSPTAPLVEAPSAATTRIARVLSDEPARAFDGLLAPTLRGIIAAPWIDQAPGPLRLGWYAGLMLKGSDRLGFHNYTINLSYQSGLSAPDVELVYGNFQLAPWYLEAVAFRSVAGFATGVNSAGEVVGYGEVVDTGAVLQASRSFWTTPVILNLHGFRRDVGSVGPGDPASKVTFLGPQLATGYVASEGSPYAGTQRGWSVSAEASGYSENVGSTYSMLDLRLEGAVAVPLPLLKLHSLRLSAIGRALPGGPDGLLRIGGIPLGIGLLSRGTSDEPAPDGVFLPSGVGFSEYLRGYEDFTFTSNGALMLGARYKLPFPIDRGWASTFYLFPSFFLRQVDFEGFWDSALTTDQRWHRAAGGAVFIRTLFGSAVPISLVYQFAYRWDDGLGPIQQFAIAVE